METTPIYLRMCELFKALNISQSEAAKRLNTSSSAINAMTNGKRAITAGTIAKLITQFGVSKEWLVDGIGEMFPKTIHQNANGDHNTQVAGNGNLIRECMTLDKAMTEIAAQRKLTEEAQAQTRKAQEQMDRLLTIIENFNKR